MEVSKEVIETLSAPRAVGTYSQAIAFGHMIFLSGQLPLDPNNNQLVSEEITDQAMRTFLNLDAVAQAAGGSLSDVVKITVYLRDLKDFKAVNEVMKEVFAAPYPARATVGVADLPLGAALEVDAIMMLREQA